MRWVGHVAHMMEERKVYKVLVGKPKEKRPVRKLRYRWENGFKMDLRETGWECVVWIHLALDWDHWWALVNTVMNLQILSPWSKLSGDQKVCMVFKGKIRTLIKN
jgi:hypothetical protein